MASFRLAVFLMCLVLPCSRFPLALGQYVPAVFAFGDSIVDAGNNNHIPFTPCKCNFPPYGKDFEDQRATGRFCNGRLSTDFIVGILRIKPFLPAYLDQNLHKDDLLTGVSFASAGSGLDNTTATVALTKSLQEQLNWFKEYVEKIRGIVGDVRTDYIVRNSIYFIVSGTCDLTNTYFTFPLRRVIENVDSYTNVMLYGATSFVQDLFSMGARTIAISNVPPIGYLPFQRTLAGGLRRKPKKRYNKAAQVYNNKLKASIQDLNTKLNVSTLIYMDTYSFFLDLVLNSSRYGFELVSRGCCGSGLVEAGPLCNSFSMLCKKNFLFWDSFHPSEIAYEIMADRILKSYFPHLL